MGYPVPKWRGKGVIFSRHATEELLDDCIALEKVMHTLEEGVPTRERRKEGTIELVKGFKDEMLKVIVVDCGENWKVITVMKFQR